jgi:hypothetical protein
VSSNKNDEYLDSQVTWLVFGVVLGGTGLAITINDVVSGTAGFDTIPIAGGTLIALKVSGSAVLNLWRSWSNSRRPDKDA